MAKVIRQKQEDFMKTKAADLLQRYMEQDSKEENLVYDDEIRAEADCCEGCINCCDNYGKCMSACSRSL